VCGVEDRKKISFGGGGGGSESESDCGSTTGADAGAGASVGAGGVSSTVLRRAGELSVRVRRGTGYRGKDEGRGDNNTDSGRAASVGDRGNTGLRGEARRGAVASGAGGSG
jgi:hypothetical protein